MTRARGGPRTQRQSRVGEVLRHALAEVLSRGDLRDPALVGVSVTVTEVELGADLKTATAWIMPLGGHDAEKVAAGLNRCARYLRGQVSHEVALRYTPQLRFSVDRSFEIAERIGTLLNEPGVRRDLEKDSSEDE